MKRGLAMRVRTYTILQEQIEMGLKRILWNEDLTKPGNQPECDARAEVWARIIMTEICEYFDFSDENE